VSIGQTDNADNFRHNTAKSVRDIRCGFFAPGKVGQ